MLQESTLLYWKKHLNKCKVFSIGDVLYRKNNKYVVDIPSEDEAVRILQAMKYLSQDRMPITFNGLVNPLIIQKNCCKRAFLRGAFLCAGSISEPGKVLPL